MLSFGTVILTRRLLDSTLVEGVARDGKLRCDHYGKVGYIRTSCYELISYPDYWEACCDGLRKKSTNFGSSRSGKQLLKSSSSR